ncbi:hypothetical protein PG990_002524 [Apiospora arundinis]
MKLLAANGRITLPAESSWASPAWTKLAALNFKFDATLASPEVPSTGVVLGWSKESTRLTFYTIVNLLPGGGGGKGAEDEYDSGAGKCR